MSYLPTNSVDITDLPDIAPSPRRVATKEGFHAVARSSPPVPVHTPPGVARPRRDGGGSRAGLILPPPGSGPGSGDADPRRLLHPARGLRSRSSRSSRPRPRARASSSRRPTRPPASRAGPSRAGCRPISSPSPWSRTSPASSKPGLVAEDWNADEYKGMVTDSVVVLAVRPGNPKGIATWDDLIKEGVEVITAEPAHLRRRPLEHHRRLGRPARDRARPRRRPPSTCASSSPTSRCRTRARASRWRPLPAARAMSSSPTRTRPLPPSRRAKQLEYVVPDQTILIENPVAVVTESANPEKAQAFIDFLRTPEAQRSLRREGLPLDPAGGAGRVRLTPRRRLSSPSPTSAAGRR